MSDLRNALSPAGRELYDRVEARYPAWENPASPFGTDRRGSRKGDAFRHLMRSVVDETTQPQGWQRSVWSDAQVVAVCNDPENLRRAWAELACDDPEGWVARWQRRNREDKIGTCVILAVLIVGGAVAFATQSGWPVAIAIGVVLIGTFVGHVRSQGPVR